MDQDPGADPVHRAGLLGKISEIIQISTKKLIVFYPVKCLTNVFEYDIIIKQSGKIRVAIENPDASVLELADRLA